MTARGYTRAGLAALVLWTDACSDDSRDPLAPPSGPSASHTGIPDITGAILGPDGTSICNSVPAGTEFIVEAVDPTFTEFVEPQFLSCPENTFVLVANPGTYFLAATFLTFDGIDGFPWSTLVPTPVTVEASDVAQNIQIVEGGALGGRVTLDGEPIPDVNISVFYEPIPGFAAAFGFSGSDGAWRDFFDRAPLTLQNGLEYQAFTDCFLVLGAILLEDAPPEPFTFPTERSSVDCRLTASPTLELTHNFNRIAVTAMPGEIGGGGLSALPDFGTGFGVQFPSTPGEEPERGSQLITQLFEGGLLIGIEPGTVLSGAFVGGHMECPFELENACRDLGLDGRVTATESPVLGKTITWRYTDEASAQAVGLRVTQRSYDAPAGSDYVLFRFTIQNRSHGTLTLSPGVFTDWDIDFDAFDDRGSVQQDGRLMYQSNLFEGATTRAGTLMVGETAPTPGFFFVGFAPPPTEAEQVAALTGELSTPPPEEPADLRYIQGVSPVTLKHGKSTDLWVAVIAGEDEAAFLATAEAAARDIETHRRIPGRVAERGSQRVLSQSLGRASASQPVRRPVCMKDCLRELKERRGLNLRIGGR